MHGTIHIITNITSEQIETHRMKRMHYYSIFFMTLFIILQNIVVDIYYYRTKLNQQRHHLAPLIHLALIEHNFLFRCGI